MQTILTDDQAASIWAGDTTSLLTLEDQVPKPVDTKTTEEESIEDKDKDKEKEVEVVTEDEITKALNGDVLEDEDENSKLNDNMLSQSIKELMDEEVLKGFEDDVEISSKEQLKELIKLNLAEAKEESSDTWWNEKVSNYSPQIQAILHYAEQGGQDVSTLLNAIGQVEEVVNLDVETEEGQKAIVDKVLKMRGFDDEDRKDQIELLIDTEKLKAKAEKFLPELNRIKEDEVRQILIEEEERKESALEASKQYLNTIKSTLDKDVIKDVKIEKSDKAKIFESLALANHTSLSGNKTNNFVKTLEELQFGKNADYERFLQIVYHAIDPEGFMEKLKTKLNSELSVETVLKLKKSKNTTPSSEEEIESNVRKNKLSSKNTFKNPYK